MMRDGDQPPADMPRSLIAMASPAAASRRTLLFAPFLAAVAAGLADQPALAAILNPAETQITLPDAINGLPGADCLPAAARWRRYTATRMRQDRIWC
jgi:hypothetical protein